MQSLSSDALWVVSTFVNATTLSAMTRVSKEWRRALVNPGRAWAHDKRFPSAYGQDDLAMFMYAMRILATSYRVSCYDHSYTPKNREILAAVHAQVKRVFVECLCNGTTHHGLFLPTGAETYEVVGGCASLKSIAWIGGLSLVGAMRHLSVSGSDASDIFSRQPCPVTHARVRAAPVSSDEYASAHTMVYHASSYNRCEYKGLHPRLVLVLPSPLTFDILRDPILFEWHRHAVVLVSHASGNVTALLELVASMDRSRVPVLVVFDTSAIVKDRDLQSRCNALTVLASDLGIRLVIRDLSLRFLNRDAWWTEADALVAMALAPADRRVRARIGE
jgi:hypothetical protein